MNITVVIPALNEETALPAVLADLRASGIEPSQVVVADGGSRDNTVRVALAAGARVVHARRGRASQLNAGAAVCHDEWLLFLHADSRLGPDVGEALRLMTASTTAPHAAVFRFRIDLPNPWRRCIELGQAIRERGFGLAYGDQGLLIRRESFEAIGRYPELPLMEDVVIIRRLRKRYGVALAPAAILTSGRRYVRHGIARTWLTHAVVIALYAAGVPPARLARWREDPATDV